MNSVSKCVVGLLCSFILIGTGLTLHAREDSSDTSDFAKIVASNQDLIIFAARDGDDGISNHLYAISPNDGKLLKVTSGELSDLAATWSPDASLIAFERGTPGGGGPSDFDIYIMDVQRGKIRPLTYIEPELADSLQDAKKKLVFSPDIAGSPSWSPDGKQIVFEISDSFFDKSDIFIMNADGTNIHPLTSTGLSYGPQWSPDGKLIAFVSNNGKSAIYTMQPDGSNIHRLTSSAMQALNPAWSPDGKLIMFSGARGSQRDLYVMDANGSNVHRLTSTNYTETDPVWSPDGTQIAFIGWAVDKKGIRTNLFVMNVDGSNVRQLTHNESGSMYFNPVWKPLNGAKSNPLEPLSNEIAIPTGTATAGDVKLESCPGLLKSRLVAGEQGRVTPGKANNLRAQASKFAKITAKIPGSATFDILSGPVCADDYAWWNVSYNGLIGWTVEGQGNEYWLEPFTPG